ncbi:AMP-binding protein [Streptomyces malaysiensis]
MTSVGHAPEKLMSLPALLARRAAENPDGLAYCYLRNGEDPDDRVTYAELRRQALVRAAELRRRDMRGRGAVLMYPTGLEFVRAWLGCTAAGVMGAPVQVPRNGQALRRLRSVADDSGTTWVLTTAETRDRLLADFPARPSCAVWSCWPPTSSRKRRRPGSRCPPPDRTMWRCSSTPPAPPARPRA